MPPSGQPQSVPVVLPAQYGGLRTLDERGPVRATRILPLSGKCPEALRGLAAAYLSWLDRGDVKQAAATSASEFLADMAWTAGMGRSHFSHRAGVVFDDSAGLRAGLDQVLNNANSSGQPESPGPVRVAFLYSGLDSPWAGLGEDLYRTEPVFRTVLDRCDQLVSLETGRSLLDVMFGNGVAGERLFQPDWANSASYALQVALTALWESIGILPSAVLGRGIGEIAAAHAAQVLTLKDGLKLAAALTGPEAALPVVPVAPPALTWVSGLTGGPVQDIARVDNAFWRRLAGRDDAFEDESKALIQAGVDLAVVLDLGADGSEMFDLAPIPVVDSRLSPGVDSSGGPRRFLQAVAAAYEAGVQVSFPGLFAGEERRRMAIPEYPFQRRSFWVRERKTTR